MTLFQRSAYVASLIGLTALGANAQTVNGYAINPRVFNNDPGSTLTFTPSSLPSNPASVTIHDAYDGAFSGANRSDVLASTDGGATAHTFNIGDSFNFQVTLNLTDGFNSPRKEAGIRINSSPASGVGDMLFIVNSDAGEIVTFGGPFHLFGNNAGGNGYTPGQTITLGIKETGKSGSNPATTEFWIDRGAGIVTTGPLAWSNTEGGPVDFNLGVYAQGDANTTGDFVNAAFTGMTFTPVPEPTTLALLSVGCLGVLAFRRKP